MRNKMTLLLFLSTLVLAACPAGGVPGIPGKGGAAKNVDPNTCGNYAATDVGKKLKGFLEATLTLEKAIKETDVVMTTACNDMAKELGIEAEGDVKAVCQAVADKIKDNINTSVTAGASLNVQYKPAECTVDINAAARWAHRIVTMKDGRVLAHGEASEVLQPQILLETFDTPFDTIPHKGHMLVMAQ